LNEISPQNIRAPEETIVTRRLIVLELFRKPLSLELATSEVHKITLL
jgi:hypothetical protein